MINPKNIQSISLDTGGTFTDCLAWDHAKKMYRLKVLSKGALRGKIIRFIDEKRVEIQATWPVERDIFEGYQFKILGEAQSTSRVVSYDWPAKIIEIENQLPADLSEKKNLSFELSAGEEAPVLAMRMLTACRLDEPLPRLGIKLGTTRGTNALLEKKGAPTAFVVTKGFKDLLRIKTQQRPDIFALQIQVPQVLHEAVIEVVGRLNAQGEIVEPLEYPSAQVIEALKKKGIKSIAISLMHAYKNPVFEEKLKIWFQKNGFEYVFGSQEISPLINYLQRSETVLVNAYLAPVMDSYLNNIKSKLPAEDDLHFKVISSAGSLVKADFFKAKDSLLSGPAGGIIGAAKQAEASGFRKIISLDMGGTSTDVSLYDQEFDYTYQLQVGEAHLQSQAFNIETVASGGGSICAYDGYHLKVGPESAGAQPGPAAYGAGGPFTLSDVNLLLGRIDQSQFGIPIYPEASQQKLKALQKAILQATGQKPALEDLLEGFVSIAQEIMAGAIQKLTLARGIDPKSFCLLAFGGAGGLHACGIAELLQISDILIPKDAGLLSAYGISESREQKIAERQILQNLDELDQDLFRHLQDLENGVLREFEKEGFAREQVSIYQRILFLRYKGQNHSLEILFKGSLPNLFLEFEKAYRDIYGHILPGSPIEVASIRVIARENRPQQRIDRPNTIDKYRPEARSWQTAYFLGKWGKIPVFHKSDLREGAYLDETALIIDPYSTTFLAPGWALLMDHQQNLVLTAKKEANQTKVQGKIIQEIELELFKRRFMRIAENMGVQLQRTSQSVNIKERLDFSCALLNAEGELVANAPHIPVHLGSLGICVREVIKVLEMREGDTIICNHPAYGGSHLPDITLISPVFVQEVCVAFVANRAHHAELGGKRPGSMPPDAQNLEEEGVMIPPTHLAESGEVYWEKIKELLKAGPYPSRAVSENLADIQAALAANLNGVQEFKQLCQDQGIGKVLENMKALQHHSYLKTHQTLLDLLPRLPKLSQGIRLQEKLDDGQPLVVHLIWRNQRLEIDFEGTAPVHPKNLNANPAIVHSVITYVLRILIQESIPLNEGILKATHIKIPDNCLLNPHFKKDPGLNPAVVGGNTETSQRLTSLLLRAFGQIAGSQATMNNVIFGNSDFGYYETIGGGGGAGATFAGASGVHHHMTNTRITDPEILEHRYPVRLLRFSLRENSGGLGLYQGGEGLIREYEFLEPVSLSMLTQQRNQGPQGLNGGGSGKKGEQYIISSLGNQMKLKAIDHTELQKGDRLLLLSPGGGAYGKKK